MELTTLGSCMIRGRYAERDIGMQVAVFASAQMHSKDFALAGIRVEADPLKSRREDLSTMDHTSDRHWLSCSARLGRRDGQGRPW